MIIALSGNYNEFTQAKDRAMTVLFTVGLIILLASSILIYVIAKRIIKPIESLSHSMERLRNGDLNTEKLNYQRKDELGNLADGFNSMISNISGMITGIQINSRKLEEQAENLSAISEELSSSSTEVANAIQEVAVGASSQAEQLSEVSSGITDFGSEINNIAQKIGSVEQNALTIGDMAKERSFELTTIATAIHSLNGLFSELSQKIINFGEDMRKINEVTDVIKGIANQTNLLALNAAIEAARAGESGRGFAVVAEEIRKLAEKSKESSSDITKLLEVLTQKSDNVASTTRNVKDELFEHLEGINSSVSSFQEIIRAIENIIPEIQAINNSAVSINSSKDVITSKIEDIASVSEENSAASAQQMNASSDEVAYSAQSLNEIAQKLSTVK
jgi:methyl-accepting chemotaxis protein